MAINTVAKAAGQCKKSKRGKELSKFFPPNSSDDLCLFFCLYPSSMVQVQAWGKDPQRKRERKSDRQWRRARKREKLMLSKFANICTFVCPNSAETPDVSPSMVWFKDEAFHQTNPANLELNWDPFNLTLNSDAKVSSTRQHAKNF